MPRASSSSETCLPILSKESVVRETACCCPSTMPSACLATVEASFVFFSISSTIRAIWLADWMDSSASFLISIATTANPRPAFPALAASIDAFRDKRVVCSAISLIVSMIIPMDLDFSSRLSITSIILDVMVMVAPVLSFNRTTESIPVSITCSAPLASTLICPELSAT